MTTTQRPPSTGWQRWLPGVAVARQYRRSWLAKDISAGLVLTALLVPAGMGYAEAAGIPAIYGLYATIVPLLAYAVFGPSRILVLGPDSSLAPLIAATIIPLAAGDEAELVALAGALSILTGLFCLLAGLARFGFLTDLLSNPVRYGYLNGIALTVILSQLPKLLGFSTDGDGVIEEFLDLLDGIEAGEVNSTAAVLGVSAIVVILAMRRWTPAIPGTLVAVVGGIAAVSLLGLADEGLSLVGELPRGLPAFTVPSIDAGDLSTLVIGAVGIMFVSFTDTSVLSRTFAIRGGYDVDPNQELVALGAANVATGFFQGFAVSSSSSRTPVAEAAGSKTQLTGVVGAVTIAVMLVAVPGLFRNLPQTVLAAVVITAAMRLVEVAGVARLARIRRGEFVLSIVCFAGVAVLGVIPGIGLAIALGLLDFVRRAWRPHTAELVRVDGLKGYHDVERHPEGHRIPGLVLYRFDAPLFFANSGVFVQQALDLVDRESPRARWLVVTAEPITDVDTTAAERLGHLLDDLDERGIVAAFASLKGPVRERLDSYGLVDRIGRNRFYRTVGQAVSAYVAETGVTWVDWEDRESEEEERP